MNYSRSSTYPTRNHGRVIQPTLLVAHTTEGGSKAWLDDAFSGRDSGYKCSVHWAVYQDGSVIEYAPWKPGEAVACWHAGESYWLDKPSCNYRSLGYEIQHRSGETYPEAQIQAIIDLNAMVKAAYPNIEYVTHAQIAMPRGRKSDPTAPWSKILPQIMDAWEGIKAQTTEEEMAIDHVAEDNAKRGLTALVQAGIITRPEAHKLTDAAGVDLVFALLGRIVEKAGIKR